MNKLTILACCAFALLAGGCAVSPVPGANESEIRYVESWIKYQRELHPEYIWEKTPLGSYILIDEQGDGSLVGDNVTTPFVNFNYTITDLDGNIKKTSSEEVARRLGTFKSSNFYGPRTFFRDETGCSAGEAEMFTGMKVGGTRTILIPGWLRNARWYSNPEQYLENYGSDSAIYTIHLEEAFTNVAQWQKDSIKAYIHRHYPEASVDDTEKEGYYYVQLVPPTDPAEELSESEQMKMNYTGFFLNGKIFDSTDEIVCKDNDIGKSSYGTTYITRGQSYDKTTMGDDDSKLVDGFAYAAYNMKHGEKGIAFFYSVWGYGYSGNEPVIPAYSPIAFEIEMLDKEEND